MEYTCFNVSIENRIAHIVLKRPEKRNSMIPEFWEELPAIIQDIDDNVRARVIIISSMGPHFSSGLDINAFITGPGQAQNDPETQKRARLQHGAAFYVHLKRMQQTFNCLEECRIPVVAAIQGGAIGGGVDLVTACDIRYAAADAVFSIRETRLAMVADVGTLQRLPRIIDPGSVAELAYTGRDFDAGEAASLGLVTRVIPDQDAALAAALETAELIAANSPLAVQGTKAVLQAGEGKTVGEALDYVALWSAAFLHSNDLGEAMASFMERRPPEFKGE